MVRFLHDPRASASAGVPPVPLRVAAVGAPRCATSSIQEALEILGFGPCLHMANVLPHRERQRVLDSACRLYHHDEEKKKEERRQRLRTLLHGHASVADFPGTFFYEDLVEIMIMGEEGEGKVILNKRPRPANGSEREEAENWSVTARESFGFFFSKWFAVSGWMFEGDRLWYAMNMAAAKAMTEMYGVDSIFSPELYLRHNERVLEVCRGRKGVEVLEFSPDMGWGPLCEFLGVDVPMVCEEEDRDGDGEQKGKKKKMVEREFPRLNERKTFRIVRNIFIAKGVLSHLALGLGIWAGWRFGVKGLWERVVMRGIAGSKFLL